MPTGELIEIYGAILGTLTILFATFKYVISSRIAPIESENKLLKESQEKLSEEVEELKEALLEEVKTISEANFEFRLKYEGGIHDIKLLLAQEYVSKADLEKIVEEMNKKLDTNAEFGQSLKVILKSIKDLNS
jgi:hypothetical protein